MEEVLREKDRAVVVAVEDFSAATKVRLINLLILLFFHDFVSAASLSRRPRPLLR